MMLSTNELTTWIQQRLVRSFIVGMGKLPLELRLRLSRSVLTSFPRRFFRYLVSAAGPQMVQIQGGPASGMWLTLDLIYDSRLFVIGTYEPYVATALTSLCRPGMTAFDIGAHLGYFTLILARLVGESGQVYAFEPLPHNVQRLRGHLRQNAFDQVKVKEIAVSESSGTATFYYWPESSILGSIASAKGFAGKKEATSQLNVRTQSVDDLIEQEGIDQLDIVKLDAEGEEVHILCGMNKTLATMHPTIICEFHSPQLARDGANLLCQYGYTLYDLRQSPKVPLAMANFVPSRTTILAHFQESAFSSDSSRNFLVDYGRHYE
jgi:FkbM family methyltransferase